MNLFECNHFRVSSLRLLLVAIICVWSIDAKGQVDSNSSDSTAQGAKPGFLSLLQEDEETNGLPAALKDSLSRDSINQIKKRRIDSLPSGKAKMLNEAPVISYRTIVQNEDRRKLENRFSGYINEKYFNISVRKIVGYEEGSYATAQSDLPGVLKVVRKNLPKVVSERYEILVDVDTSSTKGDYQFFYNLISGIIPIDSDDLVKINFWKFPQAFIRPVAKQPTKEELLAELKEKNDIANQENQGTDQPQQNQGQVPQGQIPQVESENGQLESLLERLLERDVERDNQRETERTEQKADNTLWYVLIIGATLLILALLAYIFFSGRGKNKKVEEEVSDVELSSVGLKKIAEGVFDENRPSMKKDEFKTHLLENPAAVAAFLNSIVEQNNDEALTVFAHLARPYPDLVGMVKPFMSYNNFLLVLSRLDEPGDDKIDANSIDKFLVTFNSAVKVLSNSSKSDEIENRGGKVFGFLDQLSDNQISSLLSSDKPDLASVVFAQLNRDRKLAVLENIDEELRSEILIALSDIKKMPLSIIKEVGIRYSKKAREVAGLEDVKIDGLKALVETLDELDLKKQLDIIDTMRASDLGKGERLEKMFVGMNGLINITEEVLRSALAELQTETIIKALYSLTNDVIDHVLQARPPRERELIKSELEIQPNFTAADQIAARKLVLQNVRKLIL